MGFVGSLIPALERRMASVTFSTPSSWPMTRLCSWPASDSILLRSPWVSFATGIPVQREMIREISSSVTLSCTRDRSCFFTLSSSMANCCCNFGNSPYCSSAALFRSYFCFANSISLFIASICSRRPDSFSTECFSLSHWAFFALNSSRSASSFCNVARRSWLALSVSFFNAASSISICITRRCSSSSSVGRESSSVLIKAQASSTRSIALSGRNRSDI